MSQKKAPQTLGSYQFTFESLPELSKIYASFKTASFKKLQDSEKFHLINKALLKALQQAKMPCFLLPAVFDFIREVNQKNYYPSYTFNTFEFWLNQFSGLTAEENYQIRAKISGRYVPRDDYQLLFPVANGKKYPGSHYVTAHGSPDLDTTIASFWGWVDAMSARVGQGLHIWNVPPGGILKTEEVAPLTDFFGKHIFTNISQNRSSLTLSGLDFTSQENLLKKNLSDTLLDTDHPRHKYATVVLDSKGYFAGDLRTADYEGIRQIQSVVTHCLIWFENVFHSKFIALFTKDKVLSKEIKNCIEELFAQPIKRCLDTRHLPAAVFEHINHYFQRILNLEAGFNASFAELADALKQCSLPGLSKLKQELNTLFTPSQFDSKGVLISDRSKIFKIFHQVIQQLDLSISELQTFMERIEIALKIKRQVFGFSPRYVTPLATHDEILDKMSAFNHLTVVMPNEDGTLWPMGIIKAKDIRQSVLGTVTLRDFCNREEVKIASHFEVISVIDHHKSNLSTKTIPVTTTGDAQSANVLIAEKSFEINDGYRLSHFSAENLSTQLKSLNTQKLTSSQIRIKKRLLSHELADLDRGNYYIHADRAFLEYLSYLHAIIDDTDLFSKVTKRDVLCVASLLNRMKSLLLNEEVEIIDFDDIKADADFLKKATRKIVENEDMYSLYSEIFKKREKQVDEAIKLTAAGKSFELFSDTKEQNSCCMVGQTKIFSSNAAILNKNIEKLLMHWSEKANEIYENKDQIDLHIHMVSTIPNAEEVYQGLPKNYSHRDYLWLWIPNSKQALDHLASFLNALKNSKTVQNLNMRYQVLGSEKSCPYKSILKHHFLDLPKESMIKVQKKMPIAVLSFDAGTLNSRKAQITPYLPLLVK